jgi:hypothetical protein
MRRSTAVNVAGILFTLVLAWGLPEGAWAEDDVCANRQQPLHQFLTDLSLSLNQDLPHQVLTEATASRPSSDGLSSGGRLDLLRRAFVGLGLGQVTDEKGQLVFNFNPDALHLNALGQFSPRIVVHEAAIDGALDKYIDTVDEELRAPAREGLKKNLGDLDDVEYSVRWTPKPFEPAEDLKEVASTLFDKVVPVQPSGFTQKITQAEGEIGAYVALNEDEKNLPGLISMERICADDRAKAALERIVRIMRADIPGLNAALKEALTNSGFIRLADLIEGNPRLVIKGNYRQRSGAAGADTTSVDVTWQRGWVSYRGAKKAAGDAGLSVTSLNDYFAKHGRLEGAAPLFSLIASYAETNSFLVPIAGVNDPFRQDSGHKLSIKGTAAGYFGGGRDRKLELTAAYDDVSDDKNLQNRFVANLTWVETLNSTLAQAVGGSEFVATLVWANKPEFRGEVDEDFSLRGGLKWSLGSGSKTN